MEDEAEGGGLLPRPDAQDLFEGLSLEPACAAPGDPDWGGDGE